MILIYVWWGRRLLSIGYQPYRSLLYPMKYSTISSYLCLWQYYCMDAPHGCTSWTRTKCVEKRLDGNYTRMLRAVWNKSWKQTEKNSCTATYLPSQKPLNKTMKTRKTLLVKQGRIYILVWTPTVLSDQPELIYNNQELLRHFQSELQKYFSVTRFRPNVTEISGSNSIISNDVVHKKITVKSTKF